ncbi:MAG: 1-deoxy-D-xylulose-5-phosphate reductoisomerase, partial [bacterium]
GSTGSIGVNALDVISGLPGRFRVVGLSAGGNWRLLREQAERWSPKAVAIESEKGGTSLRKYLKGKKAPKIFTGAGGAAKTAGMPEGETVLNGISGFAGLSPTLRALEAGKTVLLANKESLVAAGELVTATARKHGTRLVPVDSEHSAIFQCLRGARRGEIRRLILTASGGPLLNRKRLAGVTPEQVLRHPRWEMGRKITVDSATMMNKGLEVIEAHWLFGVPYSRIQVVVHPESIVHSMVEFRDGSVIAQLAATDMRIPIRYALTHPRRFESSGDLMLDVEKLGALNFMPVPEGKFPCFALALKAGEAGGLLPAVLNAADEIAVDAFLRGRLAFNKIAPVVEETMEAMEGEALSASIMNEGEILAIDKKARGKTRGIIRRLTAK